MAGEPEIRDSTMLPPGSSGFTPIQRQRFCSPSCRQAAWRARQPAPIALSDPGPTGLETSRRSTTVYACPECETR